MEAGGEKKMRISFLKSVAGKAQKRKTDVKEKLADDTRTKVFRRGRAPE